MQHTSADLRYSFNEGTTLTPDKYIYLVCDPQPDGRVKLSSSPITQDLPNTEDGKVYLLLGRTISNYQISLDMVHPIYQFKNGTIQLWTGKKDTSDNIFITQTLADALNQKSGSTNFSTASTVTDAINWLLSQI